jgi:hypothetical protein
MTKTDSMSQCPSRFLVQLNETLCLEFAEVLTTQARTHWERSSLKVGTGATKKLEMSRRKLRSLVDSHCTRVLAVHLAKLFVVELNKTATRLP